MIYDVGMTIAYEYDRPAVAGRHLLRLMPADVPGEQRRVTSVLTILPEPAERRPFVDFFGNAAVEVAFRAAHDEILFRVERPGRAAGPAGEPRHVAAARAARTTRSSTTAPSTPGRPITSSARARGPRRRPR